MNKRGALLLGLGVVVLGVGAYLFLRPHQFQFAGELSGVEELYGPQKVLITSNGVEILRSKGEYPLRFEVAGGSARNFSAEVLPKLEITRLRPCGWQPLVTNVHAIPPDELETAMREKKPIPLNLSIDYPSLAQDRMVDLFVDNRRHDEAVVAVGQVDFKVPANTTTIVSLPVDDKCAEGVQVKLDGAVVASVPMQAPDTDVPPGFLLDTSGKRCYVAYSRIYGELPADADTGLPEPASLEGRTAHLVPTPMDYFLQDLPSALFTAGAIETRSGVQAVPCGGERDPKTFNALVTRMIGGNASALNELRAMAEKGYGPAAYAVGRSYYFGGGVKQDRAEARKWFLLAEASGDDRAVGPLGLLYFRGDGGPRDLTAGAIRLIEAAEEYGGRIIAEKVAGMYERGEGVSKDFVKAYLWYRVAGLPNLDLTGEVSSAVDPRLAEPIDFVEEINRTIAQLATHQVLSADEQFQQWRPRRGASEEWNLYTRE